MYDKYAQIVYSSHIILFFEGREVKLLLNHSNLRVTIEDDSIKTVKFKKLVEQESLYGYKLDFSKSNFMSN